MANRYCYPLTKLDEISIEKVRVPTGVTLYAGDVVLCEELDTSITGNLEVYNGATPADYTSEVPCIVLSQGFEELSDGRRPEGNADPSTYSFLAGTDITVARLGKNAKFYISDDCLDNTGVVAPAVGVKLVPQNGDYQLATSATIGSSAAALNIEVRETMQNGGQFGASSFNGSYCRVVKGD